MYRGAGDDGRRADPGVVGALLDVWRGREGELEGAPEFDGVDGELDASRRPRAIEPAPGFDARAGAQDEVDSEGGASAPASAPVDDAEGYGHNDTRRRQRSLFREY